jgi:hypothetical protein
MWPIGRTPHYDRNWGNAVWDRWCVTQLGDPREGGERLVHCEYRYNVSEWRSVDQVTFERFDRYLTTVDGEANMKARTRQRGGYAL